MSFLINNGISESDLPVKSPSGAARVRYVDGEKSYSTGLADFADSIKTMVSVYETVDDYGAKGDGVTDDSSAMIAMLNDLGYIRLGRKPYFVGSSPLYLNYDSVAIIGAGMPSPDSLAKKLVGGSIVVGSLIIRGLNIYLSDFGIDSGSDRFSTPKEGLVADAPEGMSGNSCTIKSVCSLGHESSSSSHAILTEGFNSFAISDVAVINHHYGVVTKSRNGYVSGVRGKNIGTATVYAKSSLPESAGGVASGICANVHISDVSSQSTKTDSAAVWIHAEGGPISHITVNGASQFGGDCAVRVFGDSSAAPAIYCQVSAVNAEGCKTAFRLYGFTYDNKFSGISAVNPAQAWAFYIAGDAANWSVTDVSLVITSPSITGTDYCAMAGTGRWDGFACRNSIVPKMFVNHNLANIKSGEMFGSVAFSGSGELTLGGGSVPASGERTPECRMLPGNEVALFGVIDPSAATESVVARLTNGMNFGVNCYFCVPARTTGNAYTTATLIGSGQTLTLLAPAASTLNQITLDSVRKAH